MRRIFMCLVVIAAMISSTPAEAKVRLQVGEKIPIVATNTSNGNSSRTTISIRIEIEDNGNEWLILQNGEGSDGAIVLAEYGIQVQQKLELYLDKSIEWVAIAKKNNVNIEKKLGCVGLKTEENCQNIHDGYDAAVFSFEATDEGQNSGLIIDLTNLRYRGSITRFTFPQFELKKLRSIVDQIPAVAEKARQSASKQNLFQ